MQEAERDRSRQYRQQLASQVEQLKAECTQLQMDMQAAMQMEATYRSQLSDVDRRRQQLALELAEHQQQVALLEQQLQQSQVGWHGRGAGALTAITHVRHAGDAS